MNLHYYGYTFEQVSNYAYETFESNGICFMLQCSGLFGVKVVNNTISNPVAIIKIDGLFHRYVLEDFEINTDSKGNLTLTKEEIDDIGNSLKSMLT